MNIELLCRQESIALAKRGPKYWLGIVAMYVKGLRDALPAKVFRASYFFCRHIDDVLDGDRDGVIDDPSGYTKDILGNMDSDEGGPNVVELYRFAIGHLLNMTKDGEDPRTYFKRVIQDAMLFDHERARERRVLTREELGEYYKDTFDPVLNLQLMIAGSELRAEDMPEATTSQGHLQSIRDMESDLQRGIVNIPREDLERSGIDSSRPFTFEDVKNDPYLRAWMSKEVFTYEKELKVWESRLTDAPSKRMSRLFILVLQTYCRFYRWSHRAELINIPVAVLESLVLSLKYRRALGVKWRELLKFAKKTGDLALCYQGFSDGVSVSKSRGAGKAAFLSNAYDVVSDWHEPTPEWRHAFEEILQNEVSPELTDSAMRLYDRDVDERLDDDGLERGRVAFRFILEVMGLTERFGQKADIDDLGLLLQIVDDVIDVEDDRENGDINCLDSQRAKDYLERLINEMNDEQLHYLFPCSPLFIDVIQWAREKAEKLLVEM